MIFLLVKKPLQNQKISSRNDMPICIYTFTVCSIYGLMLNHIRVTLFLCETNNDIN